MYWSEVLGERHRYCVCQGGWTSFKIIKSDVQDQNLKVYFTPDGGVRTMVFNQIKGFPMTQSEKFIFYPYQHIKVEVFGGEITIVGQSSISANRLLAREFYYPGCVYGGEEEWGHREYLKEEMSEGKKELKNIIQCCEILLNKLYNNQVEILTETNYQNEIIQDLFKTNTDLKRWLTRIGREIPSYSEQEIASIIPRQRVNEANTDVCLIIREILINIKAVAESFETYILMIDTDTSLFKSTNRKLLDIRQNLTVLVSHTIKHFNL